MGLKGRLVNSAIILVGWGFLSTVLNKVTNVASGELAVQQLKDSDVAYVLSTSGMHFLSLTDVGLFIGAAILLIMVWWSYFSTVGRN